MIYGFTQDLEQKSFRARDYLIDTDKLAKRVVRRWIDNWGLAPIMGMNSRVAKGLRDLISEAMKEAFEKGRENNF